MLADPKQYLPVDFSPESKVWIYQAERPLSDDEVTISEQHVQDFVEQWSSHSKKVKGFGKVMHNQFIILIADETSASVSGCSTDSSVHMIQALQTHLNINFFNRQLLAFSHEGKLVMVHLNELQEAFATGRISNNSLYFNNLVATLQQLKEKWMLPLNESWVASRI